MQNTGVIDVSAAVEFNRVTARILARNRVDGAIGFDGNLRAGRGNSTCKREIRLERTADFNITGSRSECRARDVHRDGRNCRVRIGGEQNAVSSGIDANHLRMMQVVFEREVSGIVERWFDTVPHVTRVDEVLGRDRGVHVRDGELGNLDDAVLDFRLVELEHRRQCVHVERCHDFRRNPDHERIAVLVYGNGNMVVEHGRETHTPCNRADALEQLLRRRLVGRGRAHVVAVQTAHAPICLREHLNHDVHLVVVVRAVRLGDGSLKQLVVTVAVSRESTLKLVLRPAELIAARFAYGIEPLHKFGSFELEQRFVIDLVAMRLQVLHSHATLRIAPLRGGFLENRKRVFEKLRLHIRTHQAVEKSAELIEQIVIHGVEQCRDMIGVTRNGGIGDALLVIVRTAKPCAFEDS